MRATATMGDEHDDAKSATRTRRGACGASGCGHYWLGLTLGVLGAVVGVTGSVLVFDQEIDRALNPQRFAASGAAVALRTPTTRSVPRAPWAAGAHRQPAVANR